MDLKKNLFLKLTSVAVAFSLWTWVASQGDVLKTIEVPLSLDGLPEEMEIVGDPPEEISIRLRGPEIVLRNLSPERVRVSVDISNAQIGTNVLSLDEGVVTVPAGIKVDRLTPNLVELGLQRTATREVAVEPVIVGSPAPGYEIARIVVTPPRLAIAGPESEVDLVQSLTTPPINIEGLMADKQTRLRPFPEGQPGSRIRIENVDIVIRVRAITRERIIPGVGLVTRGLPPGTLRPIIEPDQAEITVVGPRDWVDSLTAGDFLVVADLSGKPMFDFVLTPSDLMVQPTRPTASPEDDLQVQVTGPESFEVRWAEPVDSGGDTP